MTTKVKIERLFEEYKSAMNELYDDQTIKINSLEPKTQNSFQRSMSRKAGISLKSKEDSYTDEQILAIINDTKTKLKEYQSGSYSDLLAQKGVTRYSMFLAILQKALEKLGLSHLIPKEKEKSEEVKVEKPIQKEIKEEISDDEVPFYLTKEEEKKAFAPKEESKQEVIETKSEVNAMNEEQIIAMIPALIDAVPKFIEKSHEAAKKVKDLEDQMITISNANMQLMEKAAKLKEEAEKGKIPETDEAKRAFIEEIAKQIKDPNVIKECSRDLAMLFVTKG